MTADAGHYEDADGRHWLHQIYAGSTVGAPERDVDQWLNPDGEIADPPEVLQRLLPAADVWAAAIEQARQTILARKGTYEADIDLLALENPYEVKP